MKIICGVKRIVLSVVLLFLVCCPPCFAGSQATSGVTAATIIDRAREFLNESSAYLWTDTRLLDHVNAGIVEIAAVGRCLESTERVTVLTGITQYSISSTYLTIENAVYSGATTAYSDSVYRPLKRISIGQMGGIEEEGHVGPLAYSVWGDKLYLDPPPSSGSSGYTVMLYMLTRPTALSSVSAVPTPAQYDEALVMFVVSRALRKWPQYQDMAKDFESRYLQQLQLYRQEFADKDVAKPRDLDK
jgi:hypothetical protein